MAALLQLKPYHFSVSSNHKIDLFNPPQMRVFQVRRRVQTGPQVPVRVGGDRRGAQHDKVQPVSSQMRRDDLCHVMYLSCVDQ